MRSTYARDEAIPVLRRRIVNEGNFNTAQSAERERLSVGRVFRTTKQRVISLSRR